MNDLSFTDEQYLNLVNNIITSKTEYKTQDFTGGSVQITVTNNNQVIKHKVSLFFGYKNRNPISFTFDIDAGMALIWARALIVKSNALKAIDGAMSYSELNALMNNTSISNEVVSNVVEVESSSISISKPRTTIVRTSYDDDFDVFWKVYPKKIGKKQALKAWKKEKPPLDDVLKALQWQTKTPQWNKDNGQYVINPTSYINQARWEDEQPEERAPF